jgi:hypothetical protein
MTLVLETGSGVANSNSYVSTGTLETYCDDRAITLASGDEEGALIRATAYLDNTYRTRFPGQRKLFRNQGLEWPRVGVVDMNGFPVADNAIPIEIIRATCEAAIRELAAPGALAPDLERGGSVKRLKAGSVEIEYGTNAASGTIFQIIDGMLSGLIGAPQMYTAAAVRG